MKVTTQSSQAVVCCIAHSSQLILSTSLMEATVQKGYDTHPLAVLAYRR